MPKFTFEAMARYSKIGEEKYLSDNPESTASTGSDDGHLRWDIRRTYSNRSVWILGFLWTLSIALAVVMTASIKSKTQAQSSLGTLDSGYSTDFLPARVAASGLQRKFTGSPLFNEEKGEYFPDDSPSLEYIGSSPAVDHAWKELVKHRYFLLTDEEAQETWGDEYIEFWNEEAGGYLGGLDLFHTLHCLDHLRKVFYPDEYNLGEGNMHHIHCIDHLRQMVQCNADMTIIPSRWYESLGRGYIDSDRTHTCRDFNKVREWASSRVWGEQAVRSRHRNGTLWEDNVMLKHII